MQTALIVTEGIRLGMRAIMTGGNVPDAAVALQPAASDRP